MSDTPLLDRLRILSEPSSGQIYDEGTMNLLHESAERIASLEAALKRSEAALATARQEALEEAASVAQVHAGTAARRRGRRALASYTEEVAQEIRAEERAEDIAAAEIARAIRAMQATGKEK